ncbi:MAG: thiamine diphosphokinase [Spirochaetales bacterium]|nr:thiamine diphosphokinase [Spirochaetales bacterium]
MRVGTLILTGGEGPLSRPSFVYDRVIAADSGADLAFALGYEITEALGDFDSTQNRERLEAEGFVACPRDKDYSDSELALMRVKDEPYDLFGGGGGRVDHLISLLGLFDRYPLPRLWLTRKDLIVSINGRREFHIPAGEDVSFFPATGENVVISTKGLVWDMDSAVLSHSWISLSNRMREEKVSIHASGSCFMRVGIDLIGCLESQI